MPGLLILNGGCWEEVRYEPKPEQAQQLEQQSPTVLEEVADDEPVPADIGGESAGAPEPQPTTVEPNTPADAESANQAEPEIESEGGFMELFNEVDEPFPEETSSPESPTPEIQSPTKRPPEEAPTEDSATFDELFGPELHSAEAVTETPATSDAAAPELADPTETTPQDTTEPSSPVESAAQVPEPETLRPSRTALAAWRMASRWSFAAALYAKQVDPSAYQAAWDQAAYAAELLKVKLPPLPESADDLQTAVITYLMRQGRSEMAAKLSEDYSPQYAALVELAVKSNILLLVYTPTSEHLEPLIADVEHAAEASGLPEGLWKTLIEQLSSRADFAEVKKSVLKLHAAVADYLAGAPGLQMTVPQEGGP